MLQRSEAYFIRIASLISLPYRRGLRSQQREKDLPQYTSMRPMVAILLSRGNHLVKLHLIRTNLALSSQCAALLIAHSWSCSLVMTFITGSSWLVAT